MAKEYKEGEKYYLPVIVDEVLYEGKYPVKLTFLDGGGGDSVSITDEPNLLLTAEEIYANRQMADKIEHLNDMMEYGRKKYDEIEELKSRNAELEALLKEVMATRDEAIRQNNALVEENDKLGTERDQRNHDILAMKKDRDNILADSKRTTEWYMEANRTASEAAEANDELKTQIAELKAERDKFAKTAKDKADLANKACTERDAAQGDLVTAKAAIDYLQEENTKLKQELKDAEASYNVVADTSIKRKNRATTMEEVIVALVEKIRRLEGDD